MAWAAASALAQVEADRAVWVKVLGMAELALLLALASVVAGTEEGRRALTRTVAGSAAAVCAAALAGAGLFAAGAPTPMVGGYGDLVAGGYARVRGVAWHPNLLASYCIFAAAVIRDGQRFLPRGVRPAMEVVLALTVLLTFSRGGMAYTVAAILVSAQRPLARRLAWASAVAVGLAVVALTLWNLALDPMQPWRVRLRDDPSLRRQAAVSAGATLAQTPLFGTGPGSLPASANGHAVDAHLTPLNVAATLGLPGLAVFLAIPLSLVAGGSLRRHPALAAGLVGLGLDGLGHDIEDFRHVWVLVGLAAHCREARPLHLR